MDKLSMISLKELFLILLHTVLASLSSLELSIGRSMVSRIGDRPQRLVLAATIKGNVVFFIWLLDTLRRRLHIWNIPKIIRLIFYIVLVTIAYPQQYNRYRVNVSKTVQKIGYQFNGLVRYLDINLNLKL
jgi:hypothetical protein